MGQQPVGPYRADASVMAAAIRWLCSPAAAGVTDQRIVARDFDEWLRTRSIGRP